MKKGKHDILSYAERASKTIIQNNNQLAVLHVLQSLLKLQISKIFYPLYVPGKAFEYFDGDIRYALHTCQGSGNIYLTSNLICT